MLTRQRVPASVAGAAQVRRRGFLQIGGTVVLVAGLLLAAFLLVGSIAGFLRVDSVGSGSMAPQIPKGADVLVAPEPASSVKVGQVIAFTPPPPYPQVTVVHEVVKVEHVDGQVLVRTKGRANKVEDPWTAVLPRTTWHVVASVPLVGYITSFARAGIVQAIVVILVVSGIVAGFREMMERRRYVSQGSEA